MRGMRWSVATTNSSERCIRFHVSTLCSPHLCPSPVPVNITQKTEVIMETYCSEFCATRSSIQKQFKRTCILYWIIAVPLSKVPYSQSIPHTSLFLFPPWLWHAWNLFMTAFYSKLLFWTWIIPVLSLWHRFREEIIRKKSYKIFISDTTSRAKEIKKTKRTVQKTTTHSNRLL